MTCLRVLRAAVAARAAVIALAVLADIAIPDYDTSASLFHPCAHHLEDSVSRTPSRSRTTLEGLVVWDTLRPLLPPLGLRATLVLAGLIVNNVAFVAAAVCLYWLSRDVLGDEQLATRASLLFCINPASVFYSMIYSESLYALLSLAGTLCLVRRRLLPAALLFGLSSVTRSNGVLLAGFFVFLAAPAVAAAGIRAAQACRLVHGGGEAQGVGRDCGPKSRQHGAKSDATPGKIRRRAVADAGLSMARALVAALHCLLLCAVTTGPFVSFQLYGYYSFCVPPPNVLSDIELDQSLILTHASNGSAPGGSGAITRRGGPLGDHPHRDNHFHKNHVHRNLPHTNPPHHSHLHNGNESSGGQKGLHGVPKNASGVPFHVALGGACSSSSCQEGLNAGINGASGHPCAGLGAMERDFTWEARPWCANRVPYLYGFVQSHYWAVGLFNYYRLQQLPNFILAAPVLALALSAVFLYSRWLLRQPFATWRGLLAALWRTNGQLPTSLGGVCQRLYGSGKPDCVKYEMDDIVNRDGTLRHDVLKKAPHSPQGTSYSFSGHEMAAMSWVDALAGVCSASQHDQAAGSGAKDNEASPINGPCGFLSLRSLCFLGHLGALTGVALLVMHVQVATRFLSACPALYWAIAHWSSPSGMGSSNDQSAPQKPSPSGRHEQTLSGRSLGSHNNHDGSRTRARDRLVNAVWTHSSSNQGPGSKQLRRKHLTRSDDLRPGDAALQSSTAKEYVEDAVARLTDRASFETSSEMLKCGSRMARESFSLTKEKATEFWECVVVGYFLLFTCLGTALFVNFYPFT
eukprot:jgi/Mesvir1/5228/Mv15356-RA.2